MNTTKTVKGFINLNKGKVSITTSIYIGGDADTNITKNIRKSLDKFSFTKSKKENNGDWENWIFYITNIEDEQYDKLKELPEKTRFECLLGKEENKNSLLKANTIVKEGESETVFELFEEETDTVQKIGALWLFINDETNQKSVSVTFSPIEEKKEEIDELVKLGFVIQEKDQYTPEGRIKLQKWFPETLFGTDIIETLENNEKHNFFGKIDYIKSNYNYIISFVEITSFDSNEDKDDSNNNNEVVEDVVDIDDDIPF